ncbi:NusG domain II-containing protein [Treponema sp. TIM-1]|uniref:NusG domain II-containing protein n=1 Tax=Treponema sp. TIM-1 TaxID=2898417 RepID=UPI00397F444B
MPPRKPVFWGAAIKVFDVLVIVLALAISVFSAVLVYAGPGRQRELVIRGPGGSWVFPLDAEEIVSVAGPLGATTVELRGGRARVLSSPCTNQLCVAAGTIHGHGQWIACLPNKVLIRVEAKDAGEELDGTVW